MTSDVTGASTVYYLPYVGNTVPVPVSGSLTNYSLPSSTPLSVSLSSYQTVGNVFDIFLTLNSGSLWLCVGPGWISSTSRGTGIGSTQLTQLQGIWVNANYMGCLNGGSGMPINAQTATYLESIYIPTTVGETSMQFNLAAAASGNAPTLGLWNAYNRVKVISNEVDSNASWAYSSITPRPADGSLTNSITWVDGLAQSSIASDYQGGSSNSNWL